MNSTQSSRPWRVGNNPKTAVLQFLKNHPEFSIDHQIDHKLIIRASGCGYLRRI